MTAEPLVGRVWNHGVMSSVRHDWATPRQLFQMLDREFTFYLDVCSSGGNRTGTPTWYSYPQDALQLPWNRGFGNVWVNPPYGRETVEWVKKALVESAPNCVVVMLLPARTDTIWFHKYCLKGEIRFLQGRLCFDDNPRKRAPFPSMIVIFRGEK